MKRVVIIGGGFAGLAAGVALAEAGLRVELIERRPFLGGRAYSFADAVTGDTVDNGQHLMMGCYHETIKFLGKIGSLDLLQFQPASRVDFLEKDGRTATLLCPPLPAPLHLLAGLFRLKGISLGDKLRALRVGLALRFPFAGTDRLTVDEWLTRCHQSERMKLRFWEPLAVATLNETMSVAAASLLVRVLKQGFDGSKEDSSMVLSKVGLSDLYTRQAAQFIERHGGSVRLNTAVSEIILDKDECRGVRLASGETVVADQYISAVPHRALKKLLPSETFERDPYFSAWRDLGTAPIVSIHLWFDRPVMEQQFAGMLGTRIQWVFNKNSFGAEASGDRQHLSLVISAAHAFAGIPKEELIRMALEDLTEVLPAVSGASLLHALVVKEQDATFSATVEAESRRPAMVTPFRNLLLAGDWTATGLPATIEGAVLSGHRCAAHVTGTNHP